MSVLRSAAASWNSATTSSTAADLAWMGAMKVGGRVRERGEREGGGEGGERERGEEEGGNGIKRIALLHTHTRACAGMHRVTDLLYE